MPQQKQFDLNLLRVFTTVCRTDSFSRAAEELDLTQSSVSNAIARLKNSVGEELFIRVGRGVKPTAAAVQLFTQLQQPLSVVEQVVSGFEQFNPQQSQRTFYVYANESVIELLQRDVERFLNTSGISIVFRESPIQEHQLEMDLQLEKVDLAIDVPHTLSTSFSSKPVIKDRLVCVVREQHPRIQGSVTREQYFAEKHIIFNMRRLNLSVADLLTREALPTRTMYSELSSLLSMLATAAKSDAIAIASESYAKEYADLFGLQILELPFETDPIDFCMIWNKRLGQNPANMWLRSTLMQLIQNRTGL